MMTCAQVGLLVALCAASAPTSQAKLITFKFTGTVDAMESYPEPGPANPTISGYVMIGDTISGSYTFESTVVGSVFEPGVARYFPVTALEFNIGSLNGGLIGQYDAATFPQRYADDLARILVGNNVGSDPIVDGYSCDFPFTLNQPVGGFLSYTFNISLVDDSATMLNTTDLLTAPPSIDAYAAGFRLKVGHDDNVSGVITSLTLVQEGPLTVAIDIRPGSALNAVNLGSHGVVPLAILSSATFDATKINPETISLAGAGVAVRGKGSKYQVSFQDANGDGRLDLVAQVLTDNLDPSLFQAGSALLTATTFNGEAVQGEDKITIVPVK